MRRWSRDRDGGSGPDWGGGHFHPGQRSRPPGIETASIWAIIDEEHAGTLEDPIPAKKNMEYFKGKYYSEGDKIYLCTRDSEMPLAYLPSELIGQYFEEVEN